MSAIHFRNANWREIQPWLTEYRLAVWVALLKHGPCTTMQLAQHMAGGDPVKAMKVLFTVRPRVSELVKAGVAVAVEGESSREGRYRALTQAELEARETHYQQAELLPS